MRFVNKVSKPIGRIPFKVAKKRVKRLSRRSNAPKVAVKPKSFLS
jgi:hypothetical protein